MARLTTIGPRRPSIHRQGFRASCCRAGEGGASDGAGEAEPGGEADVGGEAVGGADADEGALPLEEGGGALDGGHAVSVNAGAQRSSGSPSGKIRDPVAKKRIALAGIESAPSVATETAIGKRAADVSSRARSTRPRTKAKSTAIAAAPTSASTAIHGMPPAVWESERSHTSNAARGNGSAAAQAMTAPAIAAPTATIRS